MNILNTLKKPLHSKRLQFLLDNHKVTLLKQGLKGIEKESLRLSKQGFIAQTPHPYKLGSALAHPQITTDYSESLLEFITPPFKKIDDTLHNMYQIHQFAYQTLEHDEYLLSSSMPCGINGDKSIPIAQYGQSNIGKMKHVYRKGLDFRYGRTMQAIAGIHFNYSAPDALINALHQVEQPSQDFTEFKSSVYFDLIRNVQRQGWIILYLFGASPAICKNFFKTRPELSEQFNEFDAGTLYHPYATSLRMSDIGYKSNNQASLDINYNSLNGYVDSLSDAINTPYPDYHIDELNTESPQQLNSNILQIENEYYSTVRPKQIIKPCEKPTLALKRRGVQYVELRSLDLDIFNPIGIGNDCSRFIEAFLLSCLLQDSPDMSAADFKTVNDNQLKVAHQGRKPDLKLNKNQHEIPLKQWANQILDSMQIVCEALDENEAHDYYCQALNTQRRLIENPDLTPSARILAAMKSNQQTFSAFSDSLSRQHQQTFSTQPLNTTTQAMFENMAQDSHQQQKNIESQDSLDFNAFLQHYFNQTDDC